MNREKRIAVYSTCLLLVVVCVPTAIVSASDSITASFTVADTFPPAIAELKITDIDVESVTVTWVAPGDNGVLGIAQAYDMRYSETPIRNEEDWLQAIKVDDLPIPQEAGSIESIIVRRLEPSKTYYFSLRTADEIPNWSGLPKCVCGTTLKDEPTQQTSLASSSGTGFITDIQLINIGNPKTNIIDYQYLSKNTYLPTPSNETLPKQRYFWITVYLSVGVFFVASLLCYMSLSRKNFLQSLYR